MHLVFGLRGIKHDADFFINELQSRYVPYKSWNPLTKKFEDFHGQLRLSPVQLWDLSFPEEHRDTILNTVFTGNPGIPINKHMNKFQWLLKKALKLDPIPKYNTNAPILVMAPPKNLELIGIGMRKDKYYDPVNGKIYDKKPKDIETYEGI